jgi:mono/diheme cytochrome c family protein
MPQRIPQALQLIGGRAARVALGASLALLAASAAGRAVAQTPANPDLVRRGEYLVRAGGCFSCHTAEGGEPLAGGRALETPFGTFYSPNITRDGETGIGRWSDADFVRALRKGVSPDGRNYFPVFPYPSFTGISAEDATAIKAYLFSLPPVHAPNKAHDVAFPFSWRFLQSGWKFLFFTKGPFRPNPAWDAQANRGAYLVTALGHCGECHTPRNLAGAMRKSLWLAGNADGPDGDAVPNITPDQRTGIGAWSDHDIVALLATGKTPDDTHVEGSMKEVVADSTKFLTDEDREAIVRYLKAQRPIVNKISATSEGEALPWYQKLWNFILALFAWT